MASGSSVRIAVDAMGGEGAPTVEVEGAVGAVRESEGRVEAVLVGREDDIRAELEKHDHDGLPISIAHASEVISMGESPATAIRKKRGASVVVAADLHARGEVEGLVSAGNTGAVVASSLFGLGMLENVRRPAIASMFPTIDRPSVVLDVGASIDSRPSDLLTFGAMGDVYARHVLGRREPRVGLMNIGEEETKGSELTQAAYKLLAESRMNFVGNIEGRSFLQGKADVVVTDGFVGNVMLKLVEGVLDILTSALKGPGAHQDFEMLRSQFDYAEYGGAPLLGVNGVVIIAHGSSSAKAIKNAVKVAAKFVDTDLGGKIVDRVSEASVTNG